MELFRSMDESFIVRGLGNTSFVATVPGGNESQKRKIKPEDVQNHRACGNAADAEVIDYPMAHKDTLMWCAIFGSTSDVFRWKPSIPRVKAACADCVGWRTGEGGGQALGAEFVDDNWPAI